MVWRNLWTWPGPPVCRGTLTDVYLDFQTTLTGSAARGAVGKPDEDAERFFLVESAGLAWDRCDFISRVVDVWRLKSVVRVLCHGEYCCRRDEAAVLAKVRMVALEVACSW